jgi:hypothetical protein
MDRSSFLHFRGLPVIELAMIDLLGSASTCLEAKEILPNTLEIQSLSRTADSVEKRMVKIFWSYLNYRRCFDSRGHKMVVTLTLEKRR